MEAPQHTYRRSLFYSTSLINSHINNCQILAVWIYYRLRADLRSACVPLCRTRHPSARVHLMFRCAFLPVCRRGEYGARAHLISSIWEEIQSSVKSSSLRRSASAPLVSLKSSDRTFARGWLIYDSAATLFTIKPNRQCRTSLISMCSAQI